LVFLPLIQEENAQKRETGPHQGFQGPD